MNGEDVRECVVWIWSKIRLGYMDMVRNRAKKDADAIGVGDKGDGYRRRNSRLQ